MKMRFPLAVLAAAGLCSTVLAGDCSVAEETAAAEAVACEEACAAEPRAELHATEVRYTNDFDFDLLFMTIASGQRMNTEGTRYDFEAMSMPLLRGTWRGREGDDQARPEETKVFSDVPLFRLASVKTEGGDVADGRALELPFMHAVRFSTVPDDLKLSLGKLGILTMFDRRESKAAGTRWEALRNPLLRILSGSESGEDRRFSLLAQRSQPDDDSSGYALLDTFADDEFSTTRVLTLPFVDVMRADADRTAWRLNLVDSKAFSLLRTEVAPEGGQETTFVRLPLWSHLVKTTTDGDDNSSVSFLRLPFVGSVFAVDSQKRDQDVKVLFVPVY